MDRMTDGMLITSDYVVLQLPRFAASVSTPVSGSLDRPLKFNSCGAHRTSIDGPDVLALVGPSAWETFVSCLTATSLLRFNRRTELTAFSIV